MNIADNPTNVQLPGVYKTEEIPRVPIVCTGNDFSTLYAPLIRDGRMEKVHACRRLHFPAVLPPLTHLAFPVHLQQPDAVASVPGFTLHFNL